MSRTVLTITEAAHLAGIGRTSGYAAAKDEGAILGVPILRVRRRLVVPLRPLADALGLTPDDVEQALAAMPRESGPSGTAA